MYEVRVNRIGIKPTTYLDEKVSLISAKRFASKYYNETESGSLINMHIVEIKTGQKDKLIAIYDDDGWDTI